MPEEKTLTTAAGILVVGDHNLLPGKPDGPLLIQDRSFLRMPPLRGSALPAVWPSLGHYVSQW